ncbi:MAG: hypothetical protein WBA25_11490, partial [Jannaschia sp.]
MTDARIRSEPTRRAVLGGASAAFLAGRVRARDGLVVLAAASLKPPLDEIARNWPEPVAISYG